jgi:large subunit ribosomal protein L17
MRHRVSGVKLGRNTEQRKSLFKNLLSALFTNGEIQTTEAKAKAIKGIADKLISRAQGNSLPARRLLARFFGKRALVNRLVDEVAPAMKDRKSGFTRIVRLGKRMGDDSMMVRMELITRPAKKEVQAPQAEEKKEASKANGVAKKAAPKKQIKKDK